MAATAIGGVAAGTAVAYPGGGPGGGPGGNALLDEDLSLTSALDISSAGKVRTRTFEDRDGDTHTVVRTRGAKASGAVTSDIKTDADADPGALSGKIKYTTRVVDGARGRINGTVTVTSADGKLRFALIGRRADDGSYDAHVRGSRGKGSFAKAKIAGDVDVDITDTTVTLDLDGQYGYLSAEDFTGAPRPPMMPFGQGFPMGPPPGAPSFGGGAPQGFGGPQQFGGGRTPPSSGGGGL